MKAVLIDVKKRMKIFEDEETGPNRAHAAWFPLSPLQ
jgi:hypothetical protein